MNSVHLSASSSFITSPFQQHQLHSKNSLFHSTGKSLLQQTPSNLCSRHHILSCLSSSSSSFSSPSQQEPKPHFNASTKLFVSGLFTVSFAAEFLYVPNALQNAGLSFRTTEESLRNAFKNFGQLVDVNLVMDRIANRPKGFAFVRYATEEESNKAIEGMHGKFLDGRVIFVEVAKPKSEVRRGTST